MSDSANLCCSYNDDAVRHKGFYNDVNFMKSLGEICYDNFFKRPEDIDFAYDYADVLLCGACHIFAVALQKKLGYNLYVIEEFLGSEWTGRKGFHAFCQVNEPNRLYYVDARGMTSSFDEFMEVAKQFVHGEYIIRSVSPEELAEWKKEDYYEEASSFAESIIEKYKECYTL